MTAAPIPLRIVIVAPDSAGDDPHAERSRLLRIGLLEHGHNIVAVLPVDAYLPDRLAQIAPDMVVVDARTQARDALDQVVVATRDAGRPIVLFTDDDTRASETAHVSAYVVAGLPAERVNPVLDAAMARFRREQGQRRELADAHSEQSGRRVVERAKDLLITRHGLTESEAHARLRKSAMDKGLKMADVAQRFIDVSELLA